jgi:hypothetical protein
MTDEVRNKLASLPELVVIFINSMTGHMNAKTPQVIAGNWVFIIFSARFATEGAAGASRIRWRLSLRNTAASVPEVRWQDLLDGS